jgi:hypothetical protein
MTPTAHPHLTKLITLTLLLSSTLAARAADGPGRWTKAQADDWFKQHGWLRGSNYMPSSAINQLEMWQADSFDEPTIDRELGYAEDLGFNSMRVFLHDLTWAQDPEGFAERIDKFLAIADRHGIKVLFVLFDSCWYPLPYLGAQMTPRPYTHNSGWVQSPGVAALQEKDEHPRLHAYVTGVVRRFKDDDRIIGWDVWNEPDNTDGGASARPDLEPKNKVALVEALLPQVFAWAREGSPSQPLTSGVWRGDWAEGKLDPTTRIQLENSDVISFHNYGNGDRLKGSIEVLKRFDRPMMCTEYMARGEGSHFDPNLGILKDENVAAYNWGFVSGKSQTIYPWDSWEKKYTAEPDVWFHDILRLDGSPYSAQEVEYIRRITGQAK